jgi:arginine decarboxylase
MVRNLESWVSASMKKGVITAEEGRQFLNTYKSGLYGITYLER